MSYPDELPEALTSHEGFPAPVAAALAERDKTAAAVEAAERAYVTASRETHAEAEDEERFLLRDGTTPEPDAADARTARVALGMRELNAATRARDLAARRYAEARHTYGDSIAALAHRVALDAHADVERHGEALLSALQTREAASAAAGRPGEHARTLSPSGWVEAYWLSRPDTRPALTVNGLRMPELTTTLDEIAEVISGFPVDEITASAAKVGQ